MTSRRSASPILPAPLTFTSDSPLPLKSNTTASRHNANMPWFARPPRSAGPHSRLSSSTRTSEFPDPASSSATDLHGCAMAVGLLVHHEKRYHEAEAT